MIIKIYTEEKETLSFKIDSTFITEEKVVLEGIRNKIIMTKNNLIFENSESIPNMNIEYIQINGVNYDSKNFDDLKKLLI